MTEEEIKKAIENGRLPMKPGDFFVFLPFIALSVFMVVMMSGRDYFLLYPFAIIAIGIFRYYRYTKLRACTSSLPINKKAFILSKILDDPDVNGVKKENNSFTINFKSGWFSYGYDVIILYDESAYYIASQARTNNLVYIGYRTMQVIAKIKQLEAEI